MRELVADAGLAAAGIRVLSEEELAAAGNAARTAFAYTSVSQASRKPGCPT